MTKTILVVLVLVVPLAFGAPLHSRETTGQQLDEGNAQRLTSTAAGLRGARTHGFVDATRADRVTTGLEQADRVEQTSSAGVECTAGSAEPYRCESVDLGALTSRAPADRERPVPWRPEADFVHPTGERAVGMASASTGSTALGEWTQVPRSWPAAGGGGGMAYDAERNEIAIFGGCCFQGETWLYADGEWRRPDPGVLAPDARVGNVMAYHPIAEHVVMFGGSQYGETWTWDGTQWAVHHQVDGPQFRSDAAMAWMPRIGKVVMFGGYPDVDPDELGSQLDDTWAWDGAEWEPIRTATSPPARYAPGLALDPGSGDLVLFGGISDDYESLDDTWRFDGMDWHQVPTEVAPEKRSYVSMAANPAVGAVELFGGYALEQGSATFQDRWFFRDGEWIRDLPGIDEGPLPPGRIGQALVHDASAGTMVLYGGGRCVPTCGGVWTERLEETEREDGNVERRLVWDEVEPTWPLDRMSAGTMVEDPLGRGALMHGGFGDSTGSGNPNDTWLWRDGEWRELKTAGAPPGRQGPSLAVHRNSKTVVMTGGLIAYEQLGTSTWVLDGNQWEEHQPEGSPPRRYHAGMAEDPGGNVVLFGGYDSAGVRLGDTWLWDGETWTEHTGSGPSARAYPHMAYDPVREETVLFGGSGPGGATSNETWIWDGAGWEQRMPPVSPSGRLGSAIAWDPAGEQIVLFGGATCADAACLVTSDVWTWDGTTWRRHEAPEGWPSARWFSVAGPTAQGIVMFGGHGGGTGLPLSDTWLWRSRHVPDDLRSSPDLAPRPLAGS